MHWVGVDVGGTFTDVVAYDEATGALAVAKSPTSRTRQSHASARRRTAGSRAPSSSASCTATRTRPTSGPPLV